MTSHKWLFAMNQGATFVAHRVQTVKSLMILLVYPKRMAVGVTPKEEGGILT